MQELVEKATILIEALPYIKKFRGKEVLIKYGGAALTYEDIREIVELRTRGVPPPERVMALLESELSELEGSMLQLEKPHARLASLLPGLPCKRSPAPSTA